MRCRAASSALLWYALLYVQFRACCFACALVLLVPCTLCNLRCANWLCDEASNFTQRPLCNAFEKGMPSTENTFVYVKIA